MGYHLPSNGRIIYFFNLKALQKAFQKPLYRGERRPYETRATLENNHY